MKVRIGVSLAVLALVALGAASCGKKEPTEESASSAAQPAAQPVDPATAGTITGTIKLDGPAPKAKRINMASDPACSSAHPGGASDEEVVADASGDLANVIVYVKEGLGNRTFDAPKDSVTIDQHGCMYSPHVLAVMAGQPLSVKNSDQTTHNIHPVPANNREWNKSQTPGSPDIQEVFGREEVAIPVKCNVHPWMKSYIAVFKHPYFQVTGAKGTFELKNLPPGTYTIEAWQEKFGTVSQSVTVGPKESKAVNLTFRAAAAGD
jgi:plastocyanin